MRRFFDRRDVAGSGQGGERRGRDGTRHRRTPVAVELVISSALQPGRQSRADESPSRPGATFKKGHATVTDPQPSSFTKLRSRSSQFS